MAKKTNRQREQWQRQLRRGLRLRGASGPGWRSVVEHAHELIGQKEWSTARDVLEEYQRRSPGKRQVQELLLDVYSELNEFGPYCTVCRQLVERYPQNPDLQLMLAGGYFSAMRPVSALQGFYRFVDCWPEHPQADSVREMINAIEPGVLEMLEEAPFDEEQQFELAAMHEEIMAALAEGEFRRAIRTSERLLKRCPGFVPAMNNAARALQQTGQAARAIEMSRNALAMDPDNFHALSNLTQYLFLAGRREEAASTAERLQRLNTDNPAIWVKLAEAKALLGDHQAVLEAFDQAALAGVLEFPAPETVLLYHLAAVALAFQGNEREARNNWNAALGIQPGFELAKDNLADLEKPASDRHGPWPYALQYWLPSAFLAELAEVVAPNDGEMDDEQFARLAEKHPELCTVVPALLDRGDEAGRRFALSFAKMLQTPEILDALHAFCLGRRGPDKLRIEAAEFLRLKGVLPSGRHRLWINGQWQEIEMFGFEVGDEPADYGYSPQVLQWSHDALQALHRNDGITAERLLRKAIDAFGETADLLNNLAMAYQTQGREEEARALIGEVHRRWPDYFFGRVSMARCCIEQRDFSQAEALLRPLRERSRLHHSEFSALCAAYIWLYVTQRKFKGAKMWFDLWRDSQPDHPLQARFEPIIALSELLGFDRDS